MVGSGQKVSFPSNGGEAHGYLSLPETGRGPGVIVIQEWWGLTDHIADVTDRFAAAGFVALAPDLFGGRTTHDAEEAGRLMQELPVDQAARDLSGAVDYLLAREECTSSAAGVVGFCMGGGLVLLLAAEAGDKVAAAVAFYGVGAGVEAADFSRITADVLGHWAGNDDFCPPSQVDALEENLKGSTKGEITFHRYAGAGHAFFNDANVLGTYDKEKAELAWQRTLDFLRSKVG